MPTLKDLAKPSEHETRIHKALNGRVAYEGDTPVFDTPLYLLGFYNRCGSNLLAEALNSTPYFAGFREELNGPMAVNRIQRERLASFPDYIRACSEQARQEGRIYGFKASWAQIAMILRFDIHRMYPSVRILHMTRRDVVAQAVSFWIAYQTKQWTSKIRTAVAGPSFNAERIRSMMEAAMFSEQAINLVCTLRDIPQHRIVYEDFIAAPADTMQAIGRFSGLDLNGWTPAEPTLRKQATDVNDAFRARFMDYARQAYFVPPPEKDENGNS